MSRSRDTGPGKPDDRPEMEPSMTVQVRSGEGEMGGHSAMPGAYAGTCPLLYPDLICFQGP